METKLEVVAIGPGQYDFVLTFRNDKEMTDQLEADTLRRSGTRVGLLLRGPDGQVQEPLAFEIVRYRDQLVNVSLDPGASSVMRFPAKVEKIGGAWGLVFQDATFRIVPGVTYGVEFSLEGYRSARVEHTFAAP